MRIGMSRMSARFLAAMLAVVALGCFAPRHAQGAEGVPYASLWGDYTTSVPAGWTATYDWEGRHYAQVAFKGVEPGYGLVVCWYIRHSTHRMPDGAPETYSDTEDYIKQMVECVYPGGPVEPTQEVQAGKRTAKRLVVHYPRTSDLHVTARLGAGVGDDIRRGPGQHAYTILPMPSGWYALVYFAPEGGYEKYVACYDRMVAAFALKSWDGLELPPTEADAKQLETLVSVIMSRGNVAAPPTVKSREDERGRVLEPTIIPHLYAEKDVDLREQVIALVPKLKPAPAIPEGATRDFVRGVTFMKAAKGVSDYRTAVDAFQSALSSAPWWGDAYCNLGIALESAERYDEATEAIDWYLKTKPSESDAAEAKKRIYEIRAKQELAAKKKDELSSRLSSAESAFNSGNYGQALEVFREVAKVADEGGAEEGVALQVYRDLGFVYREGKGVAQDYAEAAKWWRKAAEKGDAPAQSELGLAYYHGRGVTVDYSEAVKWYRKAIEQGNAVAMNNLGVCYENGNGVPRDRTEAVNWYRKAAQAGSKVAQDNLRKLGEK